MTPTNDFDRRAIMKLGAGAAALAGINVDLLASEASASSISQPKEQALGAPLSRAEGPLKVSGQARYAIEQPLKNMAYGVTVQSTRPAGRIVSIDISAAKALPSVIDVYTFQNTLKLNTPTFYGAGGGATEVFTPIQDDIVRFNGMHIALVAAETFEQATEAASLLKVVYEDVPATLDLDAPKAKSQAMDPMGVKWGDAPTVLANAAVKVSATYTTAREYNVPLEPHACIASWEGERITVWEPSQWVGGARSVVSEWLGIPIENVRIISPYVGGGFPTRRRPHWAAKASAKLAWSVWRRLSATPFFMQQVSASAAYQSRWKSWRSRGRINLGIPLHRPISQHSRPPVALSKPVVCSWFEASSGRAGWHGAGNRQ